MRGLGAKASAARKQRPEKSASSRRNTLAYKQPYNLDEVYVGIRLLYSVSETRAQNNLLRTADKAPDKGDGIRETCE